MRQLVRFRTEQGAFALPVESVREVRASSGVRVLSGASSGVAGILDWEGEALTVLSVLGKGSQLLVLEGGPGSFCLLVDEVIEVAHRADKELRPPPPGAAARVSGVMRAEGGIVLILDAARLWSESGLGGEA